MIQDGTTAYVTQIALFLLALERPKIRTTALVLIIAGGILAGLAWFDEKPRHVGFEAVASQKAPGASNRSPTSAPLDLSEPAIIEPPAPAPGWTNELAATEFVGVSLNPDEDSILVVSDQVEIKNVGVPLDPNGSDYQTSLNDSLGEEEVIRIGEPLDPEA